MPTKYTMKKVIKIVILVGVCLFPLTNTFAADVKVNTKDNNRLESLNLKAEKQENKGKEENKNWATKLKEKIFNKWNTTEIKKIEKISNKKDTENKTKKIGSLTTCYNKSWFIEKIKDIKTNSVEKLKILNDIEVSLNGINILVKNPIIKKNIEQQKKKIQNMKQNYIRLNSKIDVKSEDICELPKLLKWYNTETKEIIENIKTQLKLLK